MVKIIILIYSYTPVPYKCDKQNNDGARRNFYGGREFKKHNMDQEFSPPKSLQSIIQVQGKENRSPDMKTAAKLGTTSILSQFAKNRSNTNKGFKIMSDDEIALVQAGKSTGKLSKRRSLATLQPSVDGKGTLAGQNKNSLPIKEAFKRKKESKSSGINVDVVPSSTITVGTSKIIEKIDNKDSDEQLIKDALKLMKSTENVDDSYWKKIAEERRLALEETLGENEKLYNDIDKLEEENVKLKQQLSELECYKILYDNLLETQTKSENDGGKE